MKKLYTTFFMLLIAVLAFAVADPKVASIDVGDGEASPGETITMTVKFSGKASKIKSVEMITREFPYDAPPIIFKATNGKKKEWATKLVVPMETPPGTYHLELKVVMENGDQLVVEDTKSQAYGKAGLSVVNVK